MPILSSSVNNPLGVHPGTAEQVRMYNREGAKINQGACCLIDFTLTSTEATDATVFGQTKSGGSNVILADDALDDGGQTTKMPLYCVAVADVEDNALGYFYIRGVIQALTGDTAAAGQGLSCEPSGAGELIKIIDNARCIAVALETGVDGSLKWVLFNGIEGFGTIADVVA